MGSSKHKKKHRHRDRDKSDERRKHRRTPSSSSSSSSSSSNSQSDHDEDRPSNRGKTMEQIEEERRLIKEEKKRQRDLRKIYETAQEKRQRRLAKKLEKEKKRKAELGWNEEHLEMSNTNNPFGDEKLTETFVWKKKLEKQGLADVPAERIQLLTRQRIEENKLELQKLEKQRLERERQREAMEKEKEFLQKIKEAEYHREWEKQEDSFHYNQVRLRSKIRIQDGRAKPIDLLAHYINEDDEDLAVEMHEPSTYLNGLTIRDLEDLLADIRVYTDLEKQQQALGKSSHPFDEEYWNDITTITEDELAKLKKLSSQLYHDQRIDDRTEGINSAVYKDVTETFKNKTPQQLEQLEQRIRLDLRFDQLEERDILHPFTFRLKIETEKGIDIAYWESLLSQLQAHMARARLHERHQWTLKRKLKKIKEDQGIFHPSSSASSSTKMKPSKIKRKDSNENSRDDQFDVNDREEEDEEDENDDEEDLEKKCLKDYQSGRYSPVLFQLNDLDLECQKRCIDENDDLEKFHQQRESVIKSGSVKPDVEDAFEMFARDLGTLNADDNAINTSVPLDMKYLWSDKYRPRKPRVFNKVHTGYDWNQYNKKHYDTDNPPPKTVQGYKFNIFYPDLIDKTKTPSYSLTVCEDNRDFAILKFHAGPPYEDIAFKIVNKEWDYSHKHGFRCHFQNGIFQLWFHFRKWKYRR